MKSTLLICLAVSLNLVQSRHFLIETENGGNDLPRRRGSPEKCNNILSLFSTISFAEGIGLYTNLNVSELGVHSN